MAQYEDVKARCLCGQVKTSIPIRKGSGVLFCSCGSCRTCTGAPFLTGVGAAESWSPSEEILSLVIPYDFSDRLREYHCSKCGTIMFTRVSWSVMDANKGVHFDVMSGTLEQFDGLLEIAAHEFVADAVDGGFADFLTTAGGKHIERWSHRPWKSNQLPLFWQSPDLVTPQASQYDMLRAHCKCGGVEFWISRPCEESRNAIAAASEEEPWWLMDGGKKFLGIMCACDSCRLDTGMEFQAWVAIPTINISLEMGCQVPPASFDIGTLKEYRSSQKVCRYHCGTCGASVLYVIDDRPGLVNVAAGLLDAPEGARAGSWVEYWTARLSSREDALQRAESLVLSMDDGLKSFGKQHGLVHKRPVEVERD